MLGALLAVFLLGAFALAVVVVLTINLRQTPIPTPEERLERVFRKGGTL